LLTVRGKCRRETARLLLWQNTLSQHWHFKHDAGHIISETQRNYLVKTTFLTVWIVSEVEDERWFCYSRYILFKLRHLLQNTHVIPLFCVAIYLKIPNRAVLKFHLFPSLQSHTFPLAQPILTEHRPAMKTLMSRYLQCLGCLLCSNITVGAL